MTNPGEQYGAYPPPRPDYGPSYQQPYPPPPSGNAKKGVIAALGTAAGTTIGIVAGILLTIIIIMMFLLHACASAVHDMNKPPGADAPTCTGATCQINGLTITHMDVGFTHDLGSDGFMDTKAQGIYVVVTAHVTNNGTKSHDLNSMYQTLHIGAKQYQADSFANVGASGHWKTSVDLAPGFSDDVTFVFDVPESSVNEISSTSATFTEHTVLNLSSGLGGVFDDEAKPHDANMVLHQ
jgi:hypothetical protein